MNYKLLLRLLGFVLLIEAALLVIPMLVSVIYRESPLPFIYTIGILIAVSLPLVFLKPEDSRIYAKEGFICVGCSWLLLSLFGALPFVFSGAIPNFIDAFFETVSGFTTTGATILTAVEGLPYGILFWRSLTHWIGGMGILVFMLALLPSLGGNAIHLMRAEVPGPQKGKLVPKMKETALILYGIYFLLTVILAVLLLCTGMPLYDSIVSSLATAGTGGFSVRNASIGAYMNPAAEWIIASFMLIFGVNFNLYFYIIVKKFKLILKNEELRTYLILCAVSTVLITINVWNSVASEFDTVADCIRAAFFQVTSIMSTTGFSSVNYELWPEFSRMLLVFISIIGASAGSTAGGLKVSRLVILLKTVRVNMKRVLKPNSVHTLRLDGDVLPEETEKSTTNYFAMYMLLTLGFILLVSLDGKDFVSTVTAVIACFNNVGPGLGIVGPWGSFASFSYFSKLVLSFAMLFGRLEIMPMLIMLSPSTWVKSFRGNKGLKLK